jgi:hypothetical protein
MLLLLLLVTPSIDLPSWLPSTSDAAQRYRYGVTSASASLTSPAKVLIDKLFNTKWGGTVSCRSS